MAGSLLYRGHLFVTPDYLEKRVKSRVHRPLGSLADVSIDANSKSITTKWTPLTGEGFTESIPWADVLADATCSNLPFPARCLKCTAGAGGRLLCFESTQPHVGLGVVDDADQCCLGELRTDGLHKQTCPQCASKQPASPAE
jgi:hypothetical protein